MLVFYCMWSTVWSISQILAYKKYFYRMKEEIAKRWWKVYRKNKKSSVKCYPDIELIDGKLLCLLKHFEILDKNILLCSSFKALETQFLCVRILEYYWKVMPQMKGYIKVLKYIKVLHKSYIKVLHKSFRLLKSYILV